MLGHVLEALRRSLPLETGAPFYSMFPKIVATLLLAKSKNIQVQFRADPVLYKENLPAAMKKFNDIGSL